LLKTLNRYSRMETAMNLSLPKPLTAKAVSAVTAAIAARSVRKPAIRVRRLPSRSPVGGPSDSQPMKRPYFRFESGSVPSL
jgi:hypothetical protein